MKFTTADKTIFLIFVLLLTWVLTRNSKPDPTVVTDTVTVVRTDTLAIYPDFNAGPCDIDIVFRDGRRARATHIKQYFLVVPPGEGRWLSNPASRGGRLALYRDCQGVIHRLEGAQRRAHWFNLRNP